MSKRNFKYPHRLSNPEEPAQMGKIEKALLIAILIMGLYVIARYAVSTYDWFPGMPPDWKR